MQIDEIAEWRQEAAFSTHYSGSKCNRLSDDVATQSVTLLTHPGSHANCWRIYKCTEEGIIIAWVIVDSEKMVCLKFGHNKVAIEVAKLK